MNKKITWKEEVRTKKQNKQTKKVLKSAGRDEQKTNRGRNSPRLDKRWRHTQSSAKTRNLQNRVHENWVEYWAALNFVYISQYILFTMLKKEKEL